ncbi:hypothetical protein DM01DRAFT_1312510 [Hesseltinella vesiculosa]|uniref:Uncharacterized protein n=1 Tax=Hesseltinella vesiculosa TaxID=101127 RepID=A0A1X2G417_9FUNG|nr:hypothetical protein DM01DRAFT_1312510 [Hesseltinella vesiculosa]
MTYLERIDYEEDESDYEKDESDYEEDESDYKEDEMRDEFLTDELPSDMLPGSDGLSKMVLKVPSVVDIVAHDLLKVPKATYMVADSEWHNGTRSDVLYVPRLAAQKALPPILIEVQLIINEPFMQKLVRYCQSVLLIHKVYPLVVVFCIDKVSTSNVMNKFKPVEEKPWMYALDHCDFWAKKCFLLSERTLLGHPLDGDVPHLMALALFLVEQAPSLQGHSRRDHPTIRQLYLYAIDLCKEELDRKKLFVEVIDVVCNNNMRILDKAKAVLSSVPGTSEAERHISSGLEYNRQVKRKYVTINEDDIPLEPLPSGSLKEREWQNTNERDDDLKFIVQYRENHVGKWSWVKCLEEAHAQDHCTRFATVEGIRTFYKRAIMN